MERTNRKLRRPKLSKQDPKNQPVTILLSKAELEMLDAFVKKYKLSSRSAYIRNLVMTDVLGKLFEDTPSLFDN